MVGANKVLVLVDDMCWKEAEEIEEVIVGFHGHILLPRPRYSRQPVELPNFPRFLVHSGLIQVVDGLVRKWFDNFVLQILFDDHCHKYVPV